MVVLVLLFTVVVGRIQSILQVWTLKTWKTLETQSKTYDCQAIVWFCFGFPCFFPGFAFLPREKLRREMKSLEEETYWCPPRGLEVLRDNTLKNLF